MADQQIVMLPKNLRFYAGLFRQYNWETPQISTGVFVATLNEAAELIESLGRDLNELREAVSPGRIGTAGYYIGVAERLRQHEIEAKRIIRPMISQLCSRAEGHTGPCNGFPRDTCPRLEEQP